MEIINKQYVIIITLLALIVSCDGQGKAESGNPGTTLEEYYRLIQHEDYLKAAKMFSNRGYKLTDEESVKMEKRIRRTAENHKRKHGIKEVIIIEETLIGDHRTAFVKYNIVYNNGEEDDVKQAFEKINEKWHLKTVTPYK